MNEKMLIITLIFSTVFTALALENDIPSYINVERCHRGDPKLNECLLKATEVVRPYLIKGVPELGVETIDPLKISEVKLEQGTGSLNVKARLFNIIIYGLSHYKFSKFEFDEPNLQFFIEGVVDNLYVESDYNLSGRVLVAPVEGAGSVNLTMDSCNMTCYQKVKVVQRKGVAYLAPVKTSTIIEVVNLKAKIEGLFEDNKMLNDIMNKVINDNMKELFEDIKPVIEGVIVDYLERIVLNSLEKNVPFDKLFPPIP